MATNLWPSLDRSPATSSEAKSNVRKYRGRFRIGEERVIACAQLGLPEDVERSGPARDVPGESPYPSSLEFLIRFVPQFEDVEIVLGSERILTRQHALLVQTSEVVEVYGIADALADHKALTEALARQLGEAG